MIAIDTNVLVYAYDTQAPKKREIALEIYRSIASGKVRGVVTNQVLAEFASVVIRKWKSAGTREDAAALVHTISANRNWTVHTYNQRTVLTAIESKQPFWDALLAQTLLENGVREIYTENVKDFEGTGVKAINPFA